VIYHNHCAGGCFDHPAEALFAHLQFRRELRRSDRVVAQLITKRDHDAQICEGGEKRDLDDSPSHQRELCRHDPAEEGCGAADHQCALPIAPPPDSNRGINEKDKEQQQSCLIE
jgi:hypothetical protein